MILLLAAALLQTPDGPTVGDTVWIERSVRLPAGATLRPRPIESSDLLDPLADPAGDRHAIVEHLIDDAVQQIFRAANLAGVVIEQDSHDCAADKSAPKISSLLR